MGWSVSLFIYVLSLCGVCLPGNGWPSLMFSPDEILALLYQ